MNKELVLNRFHLFTGLKVDSHLKSALQAGEAYQIDSKEKPYYILKLWAFPQSTYYLCRNKESETKFTIFAKLMGDYERPTFRRPIGTGELSSDLKTHLEVQFTFPRQRLFMNLYPAATAIDSLLTQTDDKREEEFW